MADFITLTCPSCGARLQITSDIDRFACAHCGAEHVVRRGGGSVSLAPVVAEIKHVSAGIDRTASELAIKRLTDEIAALEAKRDRIKSPKSKLYSYVGALLTIAAFVICYAIVSTITKPAIGLVGAAILGVLVLGCFGLLSYNALEKSRAPINQQIAVKRTELARHRAIVSG